MKSAKSVYSISTNFGSQVADTTRKRKKQNLRINTDTSHRIKSALISTSHKIPQTDVFKKQQETSHSKVPLQIFQRYLQEGYLPNNHENVVKEVKLIEPMVLNHLNMNFFETQSLSQNFSLYQQYPNILFKMYETLIQLDKNILQELFINDGLPIKDKIGVSEKEERTIADNFRFDFFIKSINIIDELITSIISIIEDKSLAIFIEQLWKFLVILLDVNTQWSQTRYKALLDIQVDAVQQQLKLSQQNLEQLREKYIQKIKGHQLRVAVEQKKNLHLKEENHKWLQMYTELENKIEEMGNPINAEGDIKKITLDLKDMEFQFNVFQKNMYDGQKSTFSSVNNLVSMLKETQQKSFSQLAYDELNLFEYPNQNDEYLLINPIVTFPKAKPSQVQPIDFIQFLFQNQYLYPNMSGPELFMQFVETDFSKGYFLKELIKQTDDDFINIVKLILGIGKKQPVSWIVIQETIKLTRSVDNYLKGNVINNLNSKRPSLFLNADKVNNTFIDLNQDINIQGLEITLGQKLFNQLSEIDGQLKMSKLILIILTYLKEKEYDRWLACCYQWQQGTIGIESRWDQKELFSNIDCYLVWQFVNLKFKNSKLQDQSTLDFCMETAYKIWLMRPKIFIKPIPEHQEISQRTPQSNTLSNLQQKSTIPYKKSITLVDSQNKK